MTFVASGSQDNDHGQVENNDFWPALDVGAFMESMRAEAVATPDRARTALDAARMSANRRLLEFQQEQVSGGVTQSSEVEPRAGERAGDVDLLYIRAVHHIAKAELIERYRDHDSTGEGHDRADALTASIDDHRRFAAWAIADIYQRPRATVELI